MKELNDGKQMTDVWRMPAIGRWEKTCGKHPTQKPLRLLVRMILASTNQGDWILDPLVAVLQLALPLTYVDDDLQD